MNGHYAIAIDGPSGAGKSSLARACASAFGFLYVDTGAIYRTVGLAAYRRGLDRRDEAVVAAMLPAFRCCRKAPTERCCAMSATVRCCFSR